MMLQVNSMHAVIRTNESVLDKIRVVKEINEARGREYTKEIHDLVVGQAVITRYNKRAYRIDDVAFDKSPDSTFTLVHQGEEFHVSYSDYLRNKHKVEVTEANQPMLVVFDTHREQIVYLVPEFCLFVGVTEQLMDDRKAWREVKLARRTDAPIKIKESTEFVTAVMSDPGAIQRMQSWRFYIEQEVLSLKGYKYEAGDILMGHGHHPAYLSGTTDAFDRLMREQNKDAQPQRLKFSIEETGKDLTINLTKNKLFDQPVIQKWGIFYSSNNHAQARTLVTMLEKVLL